MTSCWSSILGHLLQPHTALEKEVAALLRSSSNVLTGGSELTEAERTALKAMSIEEVSNNSVTAISIRAEVTAQAGAHIMKYENSFSHLSPVARITLTARICRNM